MYIGVTLHCQVSIQVSRFRLAFFTIILCFIFQLEEDTEMKNSYLPSSGLRSLAVMRSTLNSKLAVSNPAKVDGFFRTYKSGAKIHRDGLQVVGPVSYYGSVQNSIPDSGP